MQILTKHTMGDGGSERRVESVGDMTVVITSTGIIFLNSAILCKMYGVDGLSPVPTGSIKVHIT